MPDKSFILRFPAGGVNQSLNASLIEPAQVADAVNCVLENSMIGCRPGVVIQDLDLPAGLAIQGAIFYNPAEGQSQQAFGEDAASMVLAAGGFKYQVKVTDSHPETTTISITDVTGGELRTNPDYHMVWMIQAENYVIAQDGNSNTWIWDGSNPAFFSTGYNSDEKEDSKLANGASMLAYAHGRVVQATNGNRVLVGDIIHKGGLTSAANILNTTEQVYWATGSFFSPPSALGNIQAMAILPLQNTQHGHSELIIHCKNGAFSLDVSIYPRTEWITRAISRHVLHDTGSSGFYGITGYDGDQMFLSRHGVQSLRSEAATNKLGDSFAPISEPVRNYTQTDDTRLLRFATMSKSVERRRLFVSNSHLIQQASHRGGRGILVLNFQPKANSDFYSWEGLWTLPAAGYLVGNLVRGVFGNTERNFAFVTGTDSIPRIAEFTRDLPYDVLPDGTLKPIQWQVMTRADTLGDETTLKSISSCVVNFREIRGEVKFTLYGRTDKEPWTAWDDGCLNAGEECCLQPKAIRDFQFNFGAPPEQLKRCLWVQLLLKITGPGFIESIRIKANADRGGEMESTESGCITLGEVTDCDDTFDPFEYSR